MILLEPYRKYAQFSGRATRTEYWTFNLFVLCGLLVWALLDSTIGTWDGEENIGLLSGLFGLISLVPPLSVLVRRFHDRDMSGWWVLLSFVPLIGIIFIVAATCLEGTSGDNQFGKDPKDYLNFPD